MEIRECSLELCKYHKQEISLLIHECMNYGYDFEVFTEEESRDKCDELEQYIEQSSAICFLAIEEKVQGFVWAYPYPYNGEGKEVHIGLLCVDKKYRGNSIGGRLVKAVEEKAKKLRYKKVWLYADAGNNTALSFYTKNGFNKARIQFVKDVK